MKEPIFKTLYCILLTLWASPYSLAGPHSKPTSVVKHKSAIKSVAGSGTSTTSAQPDIDDNKILALSDSYKTSGQGNKLLQHGDWVQAKSLYQQAQTMWPTNDEAIYGLAQCADHDGDLPTAIADYRTNIYSHDNHVYGTVPGDGYATNDDYRMLEFAILLSRAGQSDEAIIVYNRGIGFRNYEDGEQNAPVLFPTFGTTDAQAKYTPTLFQAMAHAALASRMDLFPDLIALSHAQQAATLVPDSPVVQFYLGLCLQDAASDIDGKPLPAATLAQDKAAAQAAFQQAAALGGGVFVAAIKANRGGWALAPSAQTQPVQASAQAAK